MGNVFSFLKKNKSTKEQLEDLENEIDQIEEYRMQATVAERNFSALLVVLSVITFVILCGYLYIDYNNTKSYTYITIALSLLILVPLVGYYANGLVRIYFKWVKETNEIKRIALMKLKKKILSKVQETETFNDAKMILERFDPSALRNMSMSFSRSVAAVPSTPRIISPSNRMIQPRVSPAPVSGSLVSFENPANFSAITPRQPLTRTIKPILSQNRSIIEKAVDYVFGDGPNNRYALICSKCFAHNGMALQDEFEYIAYICAYCGFYNSAKKVRPTPPTASQIKAIEYPKIDEADESNSNSTVKITEISSELNKTATIDSKFIEEVKEEPEKGDDPNVIELEKSSLSRKESEDT